MSNLTLANGEILPEKLEDYTVNLHKRQEEVDRQIVGGKLLLWKASKEVTFVQNAPRGARSVEIHRTAHARLVRLSNGSYSVRLRFAASERQVGYQLIAEIRELNKMAQEDEKRQQWKRKDAEDAQLIAEKREIENKMAQEDETKQQQKRKEAENESN